MYFIYNCIFIIFYIEIIRIAFSFDLDHFIISLNNSFFSVKEVVHVFKASLSLSILQWSIKLFFSLEAKFSFNPQQQGRENSVKKKLILNYNYIYFFQTNVSPIEVSRFRPRPKSQIHSSLGHRGLGRLPIQVSQQVCNAR